MINELKNVINTDGFFHATTGKKNIVYLESLFKEFPKNSVFLDLGCGSGHIVLCAASAGWNAYGIDMNSNCCDVARENVASNSILKGSVEIACGNFFPSDMDVTRFRDSIKEDPFCSRIEAYSVKDVYSEIGLDLKDVDLFYHFQVERQGNILQMFSKYAKSGANLLFNQTLLDETFIIPDNVELVWRFGEQDVEGFPPRLILYKKQ